MTGPNDWSDLAARAGLAAHDLVGWLMWDPPAIEAYARLGVPNGMGWIVTWRLAPLGDAPVPVLAAATYSIDPSIVEMVVGAARGATGAEEIMAVRDAAIVPGLESIAPGLAAALGPLGPDLWRGVDAVHFGARPMFAAHRTAERPTDRTTPLSAWLAVNCLRELRGDNHWALCAAADLDAVEVGLLHSVMIDVAEYGDEEWIARSRGNDDERIADGWARLRAKGLATGTAINDDGRRFRRDLERRTDASMEQAWQEVGAATTTALCDLVEPHHAAFVARIDATAGPRWMPAVRVRSSGD